MATELSERELKLFADYVGNNKVFIVDISTASRRRLTKILSDLGAKGYNIVSHSTFEQAETEMEKVKPKIVISDYYLGNRSGLDLLQSQRENFPKDTKDSLFVIITANSSQSAVARAAEEDVDCFILKPYTLESLRHTLVRATLEKIYPSDYRKAIDAGKELMFDGQLDEAEAKFKEALDLDKKPSLAYFYLGQVEVMKKALDDAMGSYNEGLKFNNIHYKCMTGLYDLLCRKEKYEQAYAVVRKISKFFPANPKRIREVFRLAIITKNFDDMDEYYEVFKTLDVRTDELIRIVCSALMVTGKLRFHENKITEAVSCFDRAALTAEGRGHFLRPMIEMLVGFDLISDAERLIKRFAPKDQKGVDFLSCDFLIFDRKNVPGKVLDRARSLIKGGIETPELYKVFVLRLFQAGKIVEAEDMIKVAREKWPDLNKEFDILETFHPGEAA